MGSVQPLLVVLAVLMVAALVMNFVINLDSNGDGTVGGHGGLYADRSNVGASMNLTLAEVDGEIARTETRLNELLDYRGWLSKDAKHKSRHAQQEINYLFPGDGRSATEQLQSILDKAVHLDRNSSGENSAIDRPRQKSTSKYGRVWRDKSTPPDGQPPFQRCSAVQDRDIKHGTCELYLPLQPEKARKSSAADLPIFESTCFWQFSDNSSPQIKEAQKSNQMKRLLASEGTTFEDCRSACIANPRCISWTHRAPGGFGNTENACILYQEFVPNHAMVNRGAAAQRCTSGLVRAGRIPREEAMSIVASPGSNSEGGLANINVGTFGQCDQSSCLNVFHCAARRPSHTLGNIAFVLTDDLNRIPEKRNLMDSPKQHRRLLAASEHGASLIMLVPDDSQARFKLTKDELDYFKTNNISVEKAPWKIPTGMKTTAGCAQMDLIRLNAFRLTKFDAVIVIDSDQTITGDLTPIFQCASQSYVLTTSGPLAPLNLGFIALRPSMAVVKAIESYSATFTFETGWEKSGPAPYRGSFVGYGCGQGLYWTLFYENNGRVDSKEGLTAIDNAWGVAGNDRPRAFQVDRCMWNYQNDGIAHCAQGFRCEDIRMIHKSTIKEKKFGVCWE